MQTVNLAEFKSRLTAHYKVSVGQKILTAYPITKQINLNGNLKKSTQSQEDFDAEKLAMLEFINTQRELSDDVEQAISSLTDGSLLNEFPRDLETVRTGDEFNVDDWLVSYVDAYFPDVDDTDHKLFLAIALQNLTEFTVS